MDKEDFKTKAKEEYLNGCIDKDVGMNWIGDNAIAINWLLDVAYNILKK